MPSSADFDFLKNTKFFQSIPENTMRAILENFAYRQKKSGQRFIRQAEPGDRCYIIQRGTCAVKVEREGELHTVGRMSAGDIVGEMAILTGEPRSAHVDAETDMETLSIKGRTGSRRAQAGSAGPFEGFYPESMRPKTGSKISKCEADYRDASTFGRKTGGRSPTPSGRQPANDHAAFAL